MITDIIPSKAAFYCKDDNKFIDFQFNYPGDLDLEAICIFTATGFFLGDTTYFKSMKVANPATDYGDPGTPLGDVKPNWEWHYSPRAINLKQSVEEFAHLFDNISRAQTKDKKVILPLSGGLDSRSQAAVLKDQSQVKAYSYQFEDGIQENKYGAGIAKAVGFDYSPMIIPKGYLWENLEALGRLNNCLSDFTHQRQWAVASQYKDIGNLFFLGHWGDVLFDDMGVSGQLSEESMVDNIIKKIVKKGGKEIAQGLWESWGLRGNLMATLKERISALLRNINIDDANAKIRAFKSMYWAPRWTSTNLCVFQSAHDIALPYYHDDMCKFICTVPEDQLAARQIQIEYIKLQAPELAKLPWQSFDPCNLYNYKDYYKSKYLPLRAGRKMNRVINQKLFGKAPVTTRNWEIQFLGKENESHLKHYLFDNEHLNNWIPSTLINDIYHKFKSEDNVYYSHPVSMFLTLSVFSKLQHES